ncbi:XRE family transcriptional regulator [Acinetobacter johnsonii]|jgi:transcriptional regulator with XRE-family HTH domain|uniref:helix-turn-helix domain-containing protein n=1 Tax=Acinetobacter johnsonii TaxID=40214 RepID=UPI001F2C7251|nr:XRE family transcriptional regulator [Acinetobacter johnsonii]UJA03480.1 XRE family transcriptional regulator [Acinetobacter johnsonii]
MDLSQMVNENNDQRGERLRQERSRLGLSQKDFAALFGKQNMAVMRYEKGERVMWQDDLEALHASGVDVWYLITGERSRPDLLSDDAKELLKLWDAVEPSQKETLLKLVRNFAESFPNKKVQG